MQQQSLVPWGFLLGKGKGINPKGKGKGAYEVMPNQQLEDHHEVCVHSDMNQETLGGGEVDEVGWQVAVRKSKSTCDMRPARWSTRNPNQSMPMQCVPESHAITIDNVDRTVAHNIDNVDSVASNCERMAVKIDSGAIDTVMPRSVAQQCPIVETNMSKNGPGFRAANGTPIRHYGARPLTGLGDQFQPIGMKAQVVDVKST